LYFPVIANEVKQSSAGTGWIASLRSQMTGLVLRRQTDFFYF
jgi:hypothetical protein